MNQVETIVKKCEGVSEKTLADVPDRFDVVVTDQIMAHMTGTVLAEEILQIRPEMPIILCSGYSEALSPAAIAEIGICQFVLKPLILTDLTRVIRNILN